MKRRSLLTPFQVGAAITALSLAGLSQSPSEPGHQNYTMPWPGAGPNDFDALGHGWIEGDDDLIDVAMLVDGDLYVMNAPGEKQFTSRVTQSATLTALAIQPRSQSGQADRIVVSDDIGLRAYSWDPATDTFTLDANLSTAVGVRNAKGLQVTLLPGGAASIHGLDQDGMTMFTGYLAGSLYLESSRFSLTASVESWQALQWSGSPILELAVQTSVGLMVHDFQGSELLSQSLPAGSTTPAMTSFTDPALGFDRLVWSKLSPSGSQLIYVLDNRLPIVEPAINLGGLEPGAFSVGSWFGAPGSDLIAAQVGGGLVGVIPRNATAVFPLEPSFDISGATPVSSLGSSSGGVPHLAVGDFDLDGDDDLLGVMDGIGTTVRRGELVNELEWMPQDPSLENHVVLTYSNYMGMLSAELHVEVSGPLFGEATHCLVDVFIQSSVQGNLISTLPAASDLVHFDLGEATLNWQIPAPFNGEVLQVRMTPLLGNEQDAPPRIIYLMPLGTTNAPARGNPIPFIIIDNGRSRSNQGPQEGASGGSGFPPQPKVGPGCPWC